MRPQSHPKGLAKNSSLRTSEAIVQIENAKSLLRQQLSCDELESYLVTEKRQKLKESDVLRLTTLHPNFLNGTKHKYTTKVEVRSYLDELNEELGKRRGPARESTSGGKDWEAMYKEALDRQERLMTRAHGWQMTMIRMARENRELKKKLGLKVVPLRP